MPSIHRILSRVIFYGLLATIVLTAIPYGTVQPLWIALFECLVFSLGLLGLLDLVLTRSSLPPAASLALPLLIVCLFSVLQVLPLFETGNTVIPTARMSISADRFSTWQNAIKLFAMIVAGVLLLRYTRSRSRLRTLVFVTIGVGIASALLGILRQGPVSGPSWFFPLPNDGRGFAQFVNRNHFGYLMEMALGLTLGLALRGARTLERYVVLVPAAIFLWVALIVSNSRGGIFASLCEVLFLVILLLPLPRSRSDHWYRRRGRTLIVATAVKTVLIGFLIVVFAYGVSWIGGDTVTSNFGLAGDSFTEQGGHERRENVSRKDIWSSTWQLIKAHPIAGSGFGGYWIAITRYHNASGTYTPQEAHNDYLELFASGGLIGFALVLWFFVRWARSARYTLRISDGFPRAAALGAVTGIFGVMVHNFVDFGLHVTANALVFTVLLTIAGREGLPEPVGSEALAKWPPIETIAEPDLFAH